MKTLRDVKVGEHAVIEKLHGEGALKRRIMDMGLTKGTEVYVRKVAPLGDRMFRCFRMRARCLRPDWRMRLWWRFRIACTRRSAFRRFRRGFIF